MRGDGTTEEHSLEGGDQVTGDAVLEGTDGVLLG
jgi:hypothetical protein